MTKDSPAMPHDDPRSDDLRSDDTVEIPRDPTLADDLLSGGRAEPGIGESDPPGSTAFDDQAVPRYASSPSGDAAVDTAPASTWTDPADDEFDFSPLPKRSRLTTGLAIALIFMLGVLVGVTVSRALPQRQQPQIVYLLGDGSSATPGSGASAAPSGAPSGMPSGAPSHGPSTR